MPKEKQVFPKLKLTPMEKKLIEDFNDPRNIMEAIEEECAKEIELDVDFRITLDMIKEINKVENPF